ncbi:kinase [Thermodesulfobacteriota bacterium]
MIISRTPVRLSFFGGGTDYRDYFERKNGATLGVTINKYIFVSVNRLSDFFNYKFRIGYSKAELVKHVDDIVHPSVRECIKFKKCDGNLDIHIFADLPARTGLGSSSAFTVGLLNALSALNGTRLSMQQLAEEAIFVEQQLIKEKVGCQDQMHAAFGGLNIFEFSKSYVSARPVIISKKKYELLNRSIIVFFTGITRHANEILEEQIKNTRSGSNDDYLDKMYQMVYEAEDIISKEPEDTIIKKLGVLLHRGWQLKKSLSSSISNDLVDTAYKKAISAGAYGGKLAGAGAGGFLFFLAPPERHVKIREVLLDMPEVDFKFEDEGSKIIYLSH